MITPEEIARLKELCEKATAGHWEPIIKWMNHGIRSETRAGRIDDVLFSDDAQFIALCRSLVPKLIEKVERLERDKERLEWVFSTLDDDQILDRVRQASNAYAVRLNGCHDFRTSIDAASTQSKGGE